MSNKPILYTLIASPIFLVVSAPLAFIVGVFVIYWTNVMTGIIAGALTTTVFVLWAAYATYSWNSQVEKEASAAA